MRYAKNMLSSKNKKGSALIMVMLVIAGITTIIFATQRISLVQFGQSVKEEDNLMALYAAEAGIEDGLARFHFARNARTDDSKKFRFNITLGSFKPNNAAITDTEININTPIEEGLACDNNKELCKFDPKSQYYDLIMDYRTNSLNIDPTGQPVFDRPERFGTIKKDESLTLSGFERSPGNAAQAYHLRYVFRFPPNCDQRALVTLQVNRDTFSSGTSSSSSNPNRQVVARRAGLSGERPVFDSAQSLNLLMLDNAGSQTTSIVVRPYYCDVEYAFITSRSSNGIGVGSDSSVKFDGTFTEIRSIGYYGSAKRELVALVDRVSGRLFGIFDYTLGAGTGRIGRIQ